MGAQDQTERVLRELHVLLSQSKVYDKEKQLVIVDKKEVIRLLGALNESIYAIMDEYDLTKQGRDQAERAARKLGDEIISDASHKAEDVYAASVMYSDEALKRVQDIMQDTIDSIKECYAKMESDLKKEKEAVRIDQSELKSQLHDLHDTNKYLNIIEERNKQIAKEKQKEKEEEPSPFAAIKPEIRVNEDFLREHGYAVEEEEEEQPEEKMEKVTAEVSVNLDSEYFKWKEKENAGEEDDTEEKKAEKRSLFGKMKK